MNTQRGKIMQRSGRLASFMRYALSDRLGTAAQARYGILVFLKLRKQLKEGDEKQRQWMMRTYGWSIPELEHAIKRLAHKFQDARKLSKKEIERLADERSVWLKERRTAQDYETLDKLKRSQHEKFRKQRRAK